MSEHVLLERRGPVQVIRLDRPEKKNAITRPMYAALAEALAAAGEDVRCHVLLGAPGAFCAGSDIGNFLEIATGGEVGTQVLDFLHALVSCERPVIAGIDGLAVGIGTTLNLHCDLTFATPRSVFRTPFVDLGLVPEAASSLLLPRAIGLQRAFALLALGETLSAEEAREAGLIHRVVEPSELEEAVFDAAERLAAKPPQALKITRDLLRPARQEVLARIREEAEHFRARLKSHEARAAFEAFMNRKARG